MGISMTSQNRKNRNRSRASEDADDAGQRPQQIGLEEAGWWSISVQEETTAITPRNRVRATRIRLTARPWPARS